MSSQKLEIKKQLLRNLEIIKVLENEVVNDFNLIRSKATTKAYAVIITYLNIEIDVEVQQFGSDQFDTLIIDIDILHQLCELNSEE